MAGGNRVPSLPPAGDQNKPAHATRLLNIHFISVVEQFLLTYYTGMYCSFSTRVFWSCEWINNNTVQEIPPLCWWCCDTCGRCPGWNCHTFVLIANEDKMMPAPHWINCFELSFISISAPRLNANTSPPVGRRGLTGGHGFKHLLR